MDRYLQRFFYLNKKNQTCWLYFSGGKTRIGRKFKILVRFQLCRIARQVWLPAGTSCPTIVSAFHLLSILYSKLTPFSKFLVLSVCVFSHPYVMVSPAPTPVEEGSLMHSVMNFSDWQSESNLDSIRNSCDVISKFSRRSKNTSNILSAPNTGPLV